ncbi:MAG: uroporphyrinogen-III synthase [Candidatus Eremiobacteraeota bacterium]|nr:uroporphyrinogen-III synthase [Candidatus Eremiobacteraeota bacterium]
MERWQWCQAIEAAGGFKLEDWLWLQRLPDGELPEAALILHSSCGSAAALAARFAGKHLRVLSQPLTPRQRCRPYPCEVEGSDWVLLVGEAARPNVWEARPLYGQRIALTREPSQALELQQRLEELGAEVLLCPVLCFVEPDDGEPLGRALEALETFDWVVFTSPNGVRTFFEALRREGDARRLGRARLAAIGPGTARALALQGLKADLVPTESVAEGLLEAFSGEEMQGRRVLIPRAQEAREVLPEGLRARGAEVVVAPCYKTVMPEPPPGLESVDRVVLMSSSAVRHFRQICDGDPECVCIGPITAASARQAGFTRILQAEQFDLEGVIEALQSA